MHHTHDGKTELLSLRVKLHASVHPASQGRKRIMRPLPLKLHASVHPAESEEEAHHAPSPFASLGRHCPAATGRALVA